MGFVNIAKRAIGYCVPKSWLDILIDNDSWLYNAIGGSGVGAGSTIQNGSFENDVDADGIPDGWTRTLYTGGSAAFDTTTPAHGAKAYKFTSPGGAGNGGGYLETEDYILCSPLNPVSLSWLMKCTVATVHNMVEIIFYDYAKAYISTTTVYDESASVNPLSWTRFIRGAVPPSSARYFRARLTGAKNDNATAGVVTFDGVELNPSFRGSALWFVIAEVTHNTATWTDKASVRVFVPYGAQTLTILGQLKITGAGPGLCRYRIGTVYSDEQTTSNGVYEEKTNAFDVTTVAGTLVTLYLQLKNTSGGGGTTEYQNTGEKIYFT